MAEWCEREQVALVSSVYPLAQAPQAMRALAERGAVGQGVLDLAGPG